MIQFDETIFPMGWNYVYIESIVSLFHLKTKKSFNKERFNSDNSDTT